MRLHPRYFKVQQAEQALRAYYLSLMVEHDLSCAEGISILAALIANDAKYAIREERHPNSPNTKGDEADDDPCEACAQEAEELRVVGPDHRNTADYENSNPECPECGASWPPPVDA